MKIELFKYSIDMDRVSRYTIQGGNGTYDTYYGVIGGKEKHSVLKADTPGKIDTIVRRKIREGYHYTIIDARNNAEKLLKERVQKISNYKPIKVEYPCIVSTKLDGISGHTMDSVRDVYSRDNNLLFKCDYDLLPWAQFELYKEDTPLSDIVHLLHSDPSQLSMRYFDLKIPSKSYAERVMILLRSGVDVIPITFCDNERAVDRLYNSAIRSGEEGIVVRSASKLYRGGTRSTLDMKRKPVDSEEFLIVDVLPEIDKSTGFTLGILQCTTSEGSVFKARPSGTKSYRASLWMQKDLLIGRQATIEFRGYTVKNNVPFHPVAVAIRSYE